MHRSHRHVDSDSDEKWPIGLDRCVAHLRQNSGVACGSISPVLDPYRSFVVDNGMGNEVLRRLRRGLTDLVVSVGVERFAKALA